VLARNQQKASEAEARSIAIRTLSKQTAIPERHVAEIAQARTEILDGAGPPDPDGGAAAPRPEPPVAPPPPPPPRDAGAGPSVTS